jgi:hypothetical protein
VTSKNGRLRKIALVTRRHYQYDPIGVGPNSSAG